MLELWGLGDAIMMTGALRALLDSGRRVSVACSAGTKALLEPAFPEVDFRVYDPPWKAFRGKYRLWRWDWRELGGFVGWLRSGRFDEIVSVRVDPRDHALMFLSGAGIRAGIPWRFSRALLNAPVARVPNRHKVEDWSALASRLVGTAVDARPALDPTCYDAADVLAAGFTGDLPLVVLHCGARIPVRRWDLDRFRQVIRRMRGRFRFQLAVVPEPDGYGAALEPEADRFIPTLTLPQLVALLGRADLMIGNDSAPGHIAAAVGTPALTFFGPTSPEMYRPYGERSHVVIRDLCRHRPCFDYCRFPEPYCMTRLEVDDTWPEIERFVAPILAGRAPGPDAM